MDSRSDFSAPTERTQRTGAAVSPMTVHEMTVHGVTPEIAGATVRLRDDTLVWSLEGADITLQAGDGIASGIVDLVLGTGSASPAATRERSIPVDQTHTSVIVDDRWVVKIVGFWGASDRSAAILDRLQRHHAVVSPDLAGALQWSHPERGTTTLALITEFVPESSDGWTWALDDTLAYLRSPATADRDLPEWPAHLGTLTARMHAALLLETDEQPSVDPRGGDRAQAHDVLDSVFRHIDAENAHERSPVFDDEGFLTRMRSRKAALAHAIDTIPESASGPLLIPHGDYHIGQILRTASGRYVVLDFDGDPQWDADRQLRPDGAARDVAHMLVSIDIVAAAAQKYLGRVDERAWAWAITAQQQFLDAYLHAVDPDLLDTARLEGLIAEQLLLELLYAEQFLPRWRYTGDGVITRRFAARRDTLVDSPSSPTHDTEPPWTPPALPATSLDSPTA